MDKLAAMRTFVRIVEAGSLTAAAGSLDTSLPTVVRTLAALERALGASLLKRTTRRIHLTDEGAQYLERCRDILAATQEAEDMLVARNVLYKRAYQFWRDDAEYFCVPEAGGEADRYMRTHGVRRSFRGSTLEPC